MPRAKKVAKPVAKEPSKDDLRNALKTIKCKGTHGTHCGGYITYLDGFEGVIYMEMGGSCSSVTYRAILMDTEERVLHAEVWDRPHTNSPASEAKHFLERLDTQDALREYLRLSSTREAVESWLKKLPAKVQAHVQQMAGHFGVAAK